MKSFGKSPIQRTPRVPKATRGGGWNPNVEPEKPLSGQINGLKASQGEERFARALNKRMKMGTVRNFFFRSSPGLPKGVPGWKELDFEIFLTRGTMAVSIEGVEFVHRGESKRNQDALNELILMERLKKLGRPVPKIERVFDYELTDQEGAEKAMKRLGIR